MDGLNVAMITGAYRLPGNDNDSVPLHCLLLRPVSAGQPGPARQKLAFTELGPSISGEEEEAVCSCYPDRVIDVPGSPGVSVCAFQSVKNR